ncbi:DBH-like monooxygenase protein 1 homolog [Pomacea canaliculata]|uniref:DBH-like monooxygenase protein 1 homolog n=1 Tax=Pomacea canaliculata TaxID=400727 RepID=UPI000D726D62|nr:DBH-like monooxygenase protein 1 homolog [Pomacea canaliculata]
MCAYFDFENVTRDFHLIANTPIINNSYVMHHMLLFGCPDNSQHSSRAAREPFECNMGGCNDIIGAWTVGLNGKCLSPQAGYKVGATGYKRMMLQYHWNNPFVRSDFVDSSGLTLYYTPNLRPYNLGTLMTGQGYLQIPPYTDVTIATSDCTATCTRTLLTGDIYVTDAINHMHYLGKSMYIEHHRQNKLLKYITEESAYSYDSPLMFKFDEPLVIKPGDVIRTTCHFKSTDKATTTFWGEGTPDEMCFGFLSFYPAENMPTGKQCVSMYKTVINCDPQTQMGCVQAERTKFSAQYLNSTIVYQDITRACRPLGVCTDECKSAITAAMLREPCMKHQDSWELLKYRVLSQNALGQTLLANILPCQVELYKDSLTGADPQNPILSGAGNMQLTSLLLALTASVSGIWLWN